METLKMFYQVARLKSFSLGARENHVSQSAASQAVHQLEENLGVALIDRSHRPWQLTDAGKIFYEGCHEIIDRYDELERKVKHLHEDVSAEVNVGCIYSVGLRHMSDYVKRFNRFYPKTKIHLEYLHPDQVYQNVREGRDDLGIVSFPQGGRDLSVIDWKVEEMVVACHPDHLLARLHKIKPSQMMDEKFVGFDKNLVIRKEVDRFLKRYDVKVDVVLEFDNIEAIKRAVEINSGISILPRPTLDREVVTGTLVAIPFSKIEWVRPLGIIHRRGRKLNYNVQQFISLLQEGESHPLKKAS